MRRACVVGVIAARVLTGTGTMDAQEARDTTALTPIVISATHTPLPGDRLGSRVTVLTADDLRARGYASVADALAGLAGLTVARTGGPGSATAVFLRGGESDYVKVLVDGVPLNEPGGAYDFAHLTTDNVERVEIVRGPASVLYGSDAMSGVVQLITRTGGGAFSGHVRGGTYGTVEADLGVGGGDAAASYGVTAAWRRADGVYPVNSGYENATLAGRLRIVPADATSADLTFRTVSAEYRYPTDGGGAVVDTNQRQLTRSTVLGLTLARQVHPRARVRLALRGHAIGGGIDDAADGPGDTLGAYAYRSQRDLDRRLMDLSAEWSVVRGLTLTGGGGYEYQRDRSSFEGSTEFGPYGGTTDARRHNWTAYTEATFARGAMAATVGARFDRNDRFGSFGTWRASASATIPDGPRLFASGGTAFKEPTFFEQYGGSFVIGNPDLAPERTLSWEAGVEQTLAGARLRLSASYFGQRFRDLIQYAYTPVTPEGANYVNLAAADADGIEIEGTAMPIPGVRIGAQYTFLRTEVRDAGVLPADDAAFRQGDRLLRRPTHQAALDARWDGHTLGLRGGLRWTGSRADADFSTFPVERVDLAPFAVLDLGVAIRPFGRGAATVELDVRNVLAAEYEVAQGFPAPGRVILLGVRVGQ